VSLSVDEPNLIRLETAVDLPWQERSGAFFVFFETLGVRALRLEE